MKFFTTNFNIKLYNLYIYMPQSNTAWRQSILICLFDDFCYQNSFWNQKNPPLHGMSNYDVAVMDWLKLLRKLTEHTWTEAPLNKSTRVQPTDSGS